MQNQQKWDALLQKWCRTIDSTDSYPEQHRSEKKSPLPQKFVDNLINTYKNTLIAKNAAMHDLGTVNDNYDQRLLAIELLLDGCEDYDQLANIRMVLDYLRDEINRHTYTRDDSVTYIKYKLID